jgi:hypothetical protein
MENEGRRRQCCKQKCLHCKDEGKLRAVGFFGPSLYDEQAYQDVPITISGFVRCMTNQ